MYDNGFYFVSLYDGTCDQTKELETLSGWMPDDDKWVFSTSGHHMFVSFSVEKFVPYQRFSAKIYQGKKINHY